jgi:hypothetical protein
VITLGFVFAVNQRNAAPTSGVERASVAESDRLTGLADYYAQRDPANYPAELKRVMAQIETANRAAHPAFNIEKFKMEQIETANRAAHPAFNIEKFKMEQAASVGASTQTGGVNAGDVFNLRYPDFVQQLAEDYAAKKAAQQAVLSQRLAHELLEGQGTGSADGEEQNPIQRLAR